MSDGLVEAFERTVEANAQTDRKVDAALIESGRKVASRIQDAVDNEGGQEVTKALYLMPHLMNVLREMGATPMSRKDLEGQAKGGSGGKLAQLRDVTGNKAG